jgi:endonuclease/exonuclease/phosphatase family metal-dependent hydrolase
MPQIVAVEEFVSIRKLTHCHRNRSVLPAEKLSGVDFFLRLSKDTLPIRMRRSSYVPRSLGGILAALLTLSTLQAQVTNLTVRVMSANLNGNTQNYQPFAFRIFQGLKPDIVAIQEFNYSNNTPSDFRAMVDSAFGTSFDYFRENYIAAGDIPNGVISRYPIIASGSWVDTVQSQPNRGYAWAQIRLPGTNDLYIVSIHLLTSSSTERAAEASNLKALIQSNLPTNALIVVAGDLNTDTRSESAMLTLGTFLSDNPIPTDAESGGNSNTSINRNHPHDYVLPSFSFTNLRSASVFPSHSFSNGLVFDSRVYTPLSDVAPVQFGDSSNAQHMAVLKDFNITWIATNGSTSAPAITLQPQSQNVPPGTNVTFSVVATGDPPLSYQWRFNGNSITAASNTNYSITNVQFSDAGNYSVLVTNNVGSVTSSVATLIVGIAPAISSQPQSVNTNVGSTISFSVSASGNPAPNYQWRVNGNPISGATGSSYTRTNVQSADTGDYSVLVTNVVGSLLSSNATLSVNSGTPLIIAQWNFNSVSADTNVGTGITWPSIGSGTAALVGGTTATFATGSTTDPAASGSDNSGWNTTSYPAATANNKTAGPQFNVSTIGKQNIVVSWDERVSNTGSKYVRLQYSTNGTTFFDFPTATAISAATVFESKTNNLSGIAGANNNPNFTFRIVAEFESSAANTSNSNYVGAAGTYGTSGTVRFDMVTVIGTTIPASNPPPAAATLTAPALNGGQFQFTVSGSAGSNYVVQASTNLSGSNWLPLQTNSSPFNFVETNSGSYPQRFYRAVATP